MSSHFRSPEHGFNNPSISFTYDPHGNRKYTTNSERRRFIKAARALDDASARTFCLTLIFTGARISEVLALTPRQIDLEAGAIVLRTLKKRQRPGVPPVYRAVPVPAEILRDINQVHAIASMQRDTSLRDMRIWSWCRTTAWKRVKGVMGNARIIGIQASPKGLRHGFAVGALVSGVQDVTVMRWLGHTRIETTMIYTDAIGVEAHAIARRMWQSLLKNNN